MQKMLYEAVYWRPNPKKPAFEEGIAAPGVSIAIAGWGNREGDTAVIALADSTPAGAAWYRYYTGESNIRGYIDKDIPVIVIAVHKDFRRLGIGEQMLNWLLDHAKESAVSKVSLMVSKHNHAIKLYKKCGFIHHADTGDSLLMICTAG